jgi:hypothetical protein
MIVRAKTSPAECGPEQPPCLLPIGHQTQIGPRKCLLPARRYKNEPGRLEVIPISEPDRRLEWFDSPPEFEPCDDWQTLDELAEALAELEWASVKSNYPRSCARIHYLTAVQFTERILALVAIGPPEWVTKQVEDGRRDFLAAYLLATAIPAHGRSGCILLHAHWGKGFLRDFRRDAEKQLQNCLNHHRKEGSP